MTFLTWLGVGVIVVFVDPENVRDLILPGSYLLFTSVVSLAVFLLLTIIFLSVKRALWWSFGLLIFLYLRLYGLGSLLNGGLILGVLVCGELYVKMGYTSKHASINPKA